MVQLVVGHQVVRVHVTVQHWNDSTCQTWAGGKTQFLKSYSTATWNWAEWPWASAGATTAPSLRCNPNVSSWPATPWGALVRSGSRCRWTNRRRNRRRRERTRPNAVWGLFSPLYPVRGPCPCLYPTRGPCPCRHLGRSPQRRSSLRGRDRDRVHVPDRVRRAVSCGQTKWPWVSRNEHAIIDTHDSPAPSCSTTDANGVVILTTVT